MHEHLTVIDSRDESQFIRSVIIKHRETSGSDIRAGKWCGSEKGKDEETNCCQAIFFVYCNSITFFAYTETKCNCRRLEAFGMN